MITNAKPTVCNGTVSGMLSIRGWGGLVLGGRDCQDCKDTWETVV